jgi:hypothetical protein
MCFSCDSLATPSQGRKVSDVLCLLPCRVKEGRLVLLVVVVVAAVVVAMASSSVLIPT